MLYQNLRGYNSKSGVRSCYSAGRSTRKLKKSEILPQENKKAASRTLTYFNEITLKLNFQGNHF